MRLPLILAALVLLAVPRASAQPAVGTQTAQAFSREVEVSVGARYLLYLPAGYDENEGDWPLLLFLHGAGERGDSLDLAKAHGPPRLVEAGQDLPFIVVSPQAPRDTWWGTDVLNALLDEVVGNHRVDEDRVYVTGLSMGGFGTWALAAAYPQRFAAIAPVCGGGEPVLACNARNVPTWAFHGALDEVVPLARSEEMVRALEACGGDVRLTVYPEAGHDSWTETYANPGLYEWLLQHRRGG